MKENILLQLNEEIKPIKGYESLYYITSFGRVWSHERKYVVGNGAIRECSGKFLKIQLNKSTGYLHISLCKSSKVKSCKIHILVATHYILNPLNLPMVNHKDGIKSNCRKNNLEWCTKDENENHASINKLYTFKKHSDYYGVTFDISLKQRKKPWRAIIGSNSKRIHIGTYRIEVEAAQAYNNYVVRHNLNKPLNEIMLG